MLFVRNEKAMVFDVMQIVFMAISIILGNFAGAFLGGIIGIGGAIIGTVIVGVVIYYIFSMLSGQKTMVMGAILFGVCNYISTIITGYVGTMTNLQGGIIAIFAQALFLSILWGYLGGKAQPSGTVKTGLKL